MAWTVLYVEYGIVMLQQWSVFYAHELQYHDGSNELGIGTTTLSVGLGFSLESSP